MNLTLRPTSVFAGKSFVKDKVVSADALVITLFDRDGKDNQRWVDVLSRIATDAPARWLMYPQDGHGIRSQLYEFQQKPMSYQDSILLTISYVCMGLYIMVSMSKLRAVKSKVGLAMAVIFEVTLVPICTSEAGLIKF